MAVNWHQLQKKTGMQCMCSIDGSEKNPVLSSFPRILMLDFFLPCVIPRLLLRFFLSDFDNPRGIRTGLKQTSITGAKGPRKTLQWVSCMQMCFIGFHLHYKSDFPNLYANISRLITKWVICHISEQVP